jgi:hypothetical protein
MELMELRDLLINKNEIEFANRNSNSIILKIRKTPYVLYIDYDDLEEMDNDFGLLNSNCPLKSEMRYGSYDRITAN